MRISRIAVLTGGLLFLAALGVVGLLTSAWHRHLHRLRPVPEPAVVVSALRIGTTPPMPAMTRREAIPEVEITEVARNLEIVWSLRASPDGRLFAAERPGRLLVLKPGSRTPIVYARFATALGGESGLMGIALHPRFPQQPWVYVMYTARKPGGGVNRVSRIADTGYAGGEEHILLDDIPAARNHDGGALEFGPDGMLYVGTGDAAKPGLAQDLGQLNGKILRVTPDGRIPSDNPIPGSPIWAYGFRNVSGLAFHPSTGDLWAASHGPSATDPMKPKHMDSVYRVAKGRNHGWPSHLGVSADDQIVSPVIFFPNRTVPPGGLAFYPVKGSPFTNSLFMTALRAQELHRYDMTDGRTIDRMERWWPDRFGRLRAITVAADGAIYIGTSNADGRAVGDYPALDFIYRLTPAGNNAVIE